MRPLLTAWPLFDVVVVGFTYDPVEWPVPAANVVPLPVLVAPLPAEITSDCFP